MKSEIQKILQMNQAGKLTDDQAASLLEALLQNQDAAGESGPANGEDAGAAPPKDEGDYGASGSSHEHQANWRSEWRSGRGRGFRARFGGLPGHFRDLVFDAIDSALAGMPSPSAPVGNSIHLSRVDTPGGVDGLFAGNSIAVSSVGGLEIIRSKVVKNSIKASRISAIHAQDASLDDCAIHGSSIDSLELNSSSFRNTRVNGSKLNRVRLADDSSIYDVMIQGGSVKDLRLSGGSRITDCRLESLMVAGLHLDASTWNDCRIAGTLFSDVQFQGSSFKDMEMRRYKVSKAVFIDTHFNDCRMVEGTAEVEDGFVDTRFERCRFRDMVWVGCRLNGTILRDIDVSDLKVKHLDLSGLTITGTEKFLELVRQAGE
jgi:uncharacterized protein YjbI with pentapeptide repeats